MPAVTRTYTIAIIDDTGCENGILGPVDVTFIGISGSWACLPDVDFTRVKEKLVELAGDHPPTEAEIADAHRARFDRRDDYAA